MRKGYLLLALHAHLPYIRHPEYDRGILEERWLFEAITECYFPLYQMLEKLQADRVNFALTFSISPTLLTMLTDPMLQERYQNYLTTQQQLAESEVVRTAGQTEFHPLALMYRQRIEQVMASCSKAGGFGSLFVEALKGYQEKGLVEVITCAGTHGFLPLMSGAEAWRAQIIAAQSLYRSYFGCLPRGMWLPECGYTPEISPVLKECGVGYFFGETHALEYASPKPLYGVYAPVYTPDGTAVFGREQRLARQVWDSKTGYPGDYYYREFYRDIGYDLDLNYLRPFLPAGDIRLDTGFKYYRITGPDDHKEPYHPELARGQVEAHVAHFLSECRQQIDRQAGEMDRPPAVAAPYDAELFGHWWFEGPWWLDSLCRKLAVKPDLEMITPSEYLRRHPVNQVVEVPMSTWGQGGYNYYWLNPQNDWIYRHLHRAERRMTLLADLYPEATGLTARALNQAARELLLAQSSDWAFILKAGTVTEYAVQRFKNHLGRFSLLEQMIQGDIDEDSLNRLEEMDKIFPGLDYRIYRRHQQVACNLKQKRIIILSWEFPPKTVGGLGRHVYDISRFLTGLGNEVHVITAPAEGMADYQLMEGVHVHRVTSDLSSRNDFLTWVGQLNRAMITTAGRVIEQGGAFDLIHAHDWLVQQAGATLRERYRLPLVATIHATEHGRNQGIHNQLQQQIHQVERQLVRGADCLICCSRYMAREVAELFDIDRKSIRVIPNGVEPTLLGVTGFSRSDDFATAGMNLLFMGRLVPEKGVQILLEALARLAPQFPQVKLKVAGQGYYREFLGQLAHRLGIADKVDFVGFVDGAERNRLIRSARVAVFPSLYEPFGIVALEGMAGQIPVIVSDTGGLAEVVEHGVDGFKVTPGQADELAYYIGLLLEYPGIGRELSQKAWEKVNANYNWQQIALATMEVYDQAVKMKEKVV